MLRGAKAAETLAETGDLGILLATHANQSTSIHINPFFFQPQADTDPLRKHVTRYHKQHQFPENASTSQKPPNPQSPQLSSVVRRGTFRVRKCNGPEVLPGGQWRQGTHRSLRTRHGDGAVPRGEAPLPGAAQRNGLSETVVRRCRHA